MSVSTPCDRPLLALRGIHKRFPGVHALRGIDLDVRPGEVHAVVGENGAGKSTLMQILAGVYPADSGEMDFADHVDVHLPDERAAQALGIALVYQERSLFGPLSVAENIFAARQPISRWGWIDRAELRRQARTLLRKVGLDLDPDEPLEILSSAQQQLVEVAKALSLEPKLILFDEPTAALAPAETERLFEVIRRLRSRGVGVVYISHRLEEVFTIADRVTVLKDGVGQGTYGVEQLTVNQLVALMVGRELQLHSRRGDPPVGRPKPLFEVDGLSDPADRLERRPRLQAVSFTLHAGEIVGLAGLIGAGRTELALALFGARPGVVGRVSIDGKSVQCRSPADAIAVGIGYLPEDRKDGGLFLEMSIEDNIAAAASDRFGTWRYRWREQRAAAQELCRSLRVVCRGPSELVQNLSGGNQQKIVLARWLLRQPRVLIVDEPTRGVDVGAKAEIHHLLEDLAQKGTAILVISSDLPEILAVSDRVLVMRDGRITGELTREQATEQAIMELASMG